MAWWREPSASSSPKGAGAVGALYLFAISALFVSGPLVSADEPVMGTAAGVIANLVSARYADEVARITVLLTAATLLAGVALGLTAGALMAARDWTQRRVPSSRLVSAGTLIALIAFLHAAFVAWSMARHPEAYAASFYEANGRRRGVELVVTDWLTPDLIAIGSATACVVFVLGWPTRWRASVGRLAAAVRESSRAWRVVTIAGIAIAALVLAVKRLPSTSTPRDPGRLNVIILASDGVRADRIRPEIAPRLAALAAASTRFDRAYVTVPRTFSSWVTILTGRHAHHHGVRSTSDAWESRARSFDALPDRFAAAGYHTAVVSDFAGDIFGRIPLGFADVHVPRDDFRQMLQNRGFARDPMLLPFLDTPLGRAAFPSLEANQTLTDPTRVANDAIREIRGAQGAPFFLTVFFSTTHFPYAAPFPFYRRADPAYRGAFKYGRPVGLSAAPAMTSDDIRQARALYDGAVSSVDEAIGSILDEVARDHLRERTLIVVTSDHGETLFEPRPEAKGLFGGHGEYLFGDEGTHVPLLVFDPRATAHREAAVVSSVDLAPTLYDLAGVKGPDDLDGRSLAPAVAGAPIGSMPAFAETELWIADPFLPESLRLPCPPASGLLTVDEAHGDEIVVRPDLVNLSLVARHRMVRDARWKLIYMPTRAGARYALFDTEHDPSETHDVIGSEPEEGARLQGLLWRWMLQDPAMTRERGYLLPKIAATVPAAGGGAQ